MVRGIYSHELEDSDFAWLFSTLKEKNPQLTMVDIQGLPVVFINIPHLNHLLPAPKELSLLSAPANKNQHIEDT
jgi:hypothetical protein